MAGADYKRCAKCHGKAIYDADWHDRVEPGQACMALCEECSITHELKVVEKDSQPFVIQSVDGDRMLIQPATPGGNVVVQIYQEMNGDTNAIILVPDAVAALINQLKARHHQEPWVESRLDDEVCQPCRERHGTPAGLAGPIIGICENINGCRCLILTPGADPRPLTDSQSKG